MNIAIHSHSLSFFYQLSDFIIIVHTILYIYALYVLALMLRRYIPANGKQDPPLSNYTLERTYYYYIYCNSKLNNYFYYTLAHIHGLCEATQVITTVRLSRPWHSSYLHHQHRTTKLTRKLASVDVSVCLLSKSHGL